jgi:glycosyltransferase involved in cell wall biosynthesis
MRFAFVHEWLVEYGGSEKVLERCLSLAPDAPIYSLIYDKEKYTQSPIANHQVHTSFIQKMPFRKRFRMYLPFMPLAIERFDVGDVDVVISSNHCVAKGVLTRSDQLHISYIHAPMRYAWDLHFPMMEQAHLRKGLRGMIASSVFKKLRQWDVLAANRVDVFVANSKYVARRIRKVYRRDAQVIYPPVDVERFKPDQQRDDFYLTVCRCVPYKHVEMIVMAFNRLGRPLVVIGDGPELERIRRITNPHITLLGKQSDAVVVDHMQRCRAFVNASDEDFGIAPVEAQAAGAPVIAYGRGGTGETVLNGVTGVHFQKQTIEGIVAAVKDFESDSARFDAARIREHAQQFDASRFDSQMRQLIDAEWAKFQA